MGIDQGGHLTHGAAPAMSGKWFNAIAYGVRKDNGLIDYDAVKDLAIKHKPKLIIAGGSAYSRIIDFKIFKDIAKEVGAYLLVDMAHFSGLVAGGVYPNPIEYADVVTSTTHKVLRGPRGGIILTNNEELAKKFNSAVFPGSPSLLPLPSPTIPPCLLTRMLSIPSTSTPAPRTGFLVSLAAPLPAYRVLL